MDISERIESFARLGDIMRDVANNRKNAYSTRFNIIIDNLYLKNAWFTPDNVRMSIQAIGEMISPANLHKWVNGYEALKKEIKPSDIAVIMAGNIPLAGFHDFLCVLISGNNVIAKTSSKDDILITFIRDILCSVNPSFEKNITITDGIIKDFDGVIATGSNNSSRYFDFYFGKYPHIIRKNRNSIAIIDGTETDAELDKLGNDIFSYFGLGCRSISKIFIPAGYPLQNMFHLWDKKFSHIINHSAYTNNYDYNKAIYIVNKEPFLDTGYLLVKNNTNIASPVAVLHYEEYHNDTQIAEYIKNEKDNLQCVAGHGYIPFGKVQYPSLWDYADNIDTIDFLIKISREK